MVTRLPIGTITRGARALGSLASSAALAVLMSCSGGGGSSHESADASAGANAPEPAALQTALRLAASTPLEEHLTPNTDGWIAAEDGITSPGWRAVTNEPVYTLGARLSSHSDGAFDVGIGQSERYRVQLRLVGAAGSPVTLSGGRATSERVLPATDAVYVAERDRVEALFVLNDASAPHEFTWNVQLPPGLPKMELEPTGTLDILDESATPRLRMPRPFSIDADGRRRDAELVVSDGRLSLRLGSAELKYPVLVDPVVETAFWTQRDRGTMIGRHRHATAYDSARNRVVVFGGEAATGAAVGDTWEWDGVHWTLLATTGPSPRMDIPMTYDPVHAKTVLFGGFTGSAELQDTWLWDGTAWAPITPATTKPGAQSSSGMVWNTATSKVLMYAGTLRETWQWDGSDWAKLTPATTAPTARQTVAMAFDTTRGRAVIFGGCVDFFCTSVLADTWEWNGTDWFNVTPGTGSPSARGWMNLAFLPATGKTVLFGGYDGVSTTSALGDTYLWDGTKWAPASPSASPPSRGQYGMVYSSVSGNVLLVGGSSEPYYGYNSWSDVWRWNGTTWSEAVPGSPYARAGVAIAYDSTRAQTVLFGGTNDSGYLSDTWEWSGTAWAKRAPTKSPSPRAYYAVAYDSFRGRTVLFGGSDSTGNLADTWEWDGATWADKTPASGSPSARSGFAMAYDSVRHRTVLFGGYDSTGLVGDTYEWDGTNWTPKATGPNPRDYHTMVFDTVRNRALVIGGYAGSGFPPDVVWGWDGATWTQQTPNPPLGGIAEHGTAFDSARGRAVLYGGCTTSGICSAGQTTWEWNGTGWSQISVSGPGKRLSPAMAFDSARRRTILYSGGTPTEIGDLWEYYTHGGACTTDSQCDTGHCVDGVCCEVASCGVCAACNGATPGLCTPVVNADDPDSCSGTCDATSTCKKKKGQACTTAGECITSNCADSVCCDTACSGACDVCSAALGASADGTCSNAPSTYAGNPGCGIYLCSGSSALCPTTCTGDASCAAGNYCGADTKCHSKKAQGAACNATPTGDCLINNCAVCASGNCVDGVCCNTACSGACDACAATTGVCGFVPKGSAGNPSCAPSLCTGTSASCGTTCASDTDCAASGYCRASDRTCQPDQDVGFACTSNSQCKLGHCVDGYCCDTACSGTCQACAAALKASATGNGTCGAAAAGKDPHNDCADDGASSCQHDGQCNGTGACRLYAQGTSCGGTTCSGNLVKGSICDGLGTCSIDPNGTACAPYQCVGSGCANPCASDSQCVFGNFCDAGTCRAKLTGGQACSAAGQCGSGFCVEGVCCDTACNGICQACTATGKGSGLDGVCGFAAQGADPHNDCPDDGTTSCQRDGVCDGAGACEKYASGTACGASVCIGNVQTGYACSGTGSCLANAKTDCGAYDCTGGKCNTTCASDSDCVPGAFCQQNSCQMKSPKGTACTTSGECASGICVDGMCCDAACTGQCEACDVPGAEGTCVPVVGQPRGTRTACAAGTTADPCKAAACDGTTRDSCKGFVGPSVSCRAASCTNGAAVEAAGCNGKGNCPAANPETCEPYACAPDKTTCLVSCKSDTDCATSYRCVGSLCIAGATCDGDHTVTAGSGEKVDCAPYRCESSGACKTSCGSVDDCATPAICNQSGHCEVPAEGGVSSSHDSGGCALVASSEPRRTSAWWIALTALGLGSFRLRRRRAAESSVSSAIT